MTDFFVVWFTDLLRWSILVWSLHNHMWSRLLKGKERVLQKFWGWKFTKHLIAIYSLITIHLTALAHTICEGFLLFWNISFPFFVWSLYVLDDSGMEKDLCLFTEPFALWWMTQPAFSEMHHFLPIISWTLFDALCTSSRAAFMVRVWAQPSKLLISTIHCLTHCKNNLNSDERNYKFSPTQELYFH